jgi:hypothetical protein
MLFMKHRSVWNVFVPITKLNMRFYYLATKFIRHGCVNPSENRRHSQAPKNMWSQSRTCCHHEGEPPRSTEYTKWRSLPSDLEWLPHVPYTQQVSPEQWVNFVGAKPTLYKLSGFFFRNAEYPGLYINWCIRSHLFHYLGSCLLQFNDHISST